MDGTFHPTCTKLRIESECFYDRKSSYSISYLVSNDLRGKIIALLLVFSISVHDSWLLSDTHFYRDGDVSHYNCCQHGIYSTCRRIFLTYKGPVHTFDRMGTMDVSIDASEYRRNTWLVMSKKISGPSGAPSSYIWQAVLQKGFEFGVLWIYFMQNDIQLRIEGLSSRPFQKN